MSVQNLISVREAAAILGVSHSRVRQFYGGERRLIPYRNPLGDIRVDHAEVIKLRDERATYRPARVPA